jgi:hypothetical protein
MKRDTTPSHRALAHNAVGNLLKSQFNPNEAPMDEPLIQPINQTKRKIHNKGVDNSKRNLGVDSGEDWETIFDDKVKNRSMNFLSKRPKSVKPHANELS